MDPSPLSPHGASAAELKERLAAERAGSAFVVLRDGDGGQRIVALDPAHAPLTIGRSSATDLALVWDDAVSRTHAELDVVGGEWALADDGLSSNGSFVNGERVSGRRRLRDGDELRIGGTRIVFRLPRGSDGKTTRLTGGAVVAAAVTEAQRHVLVALCRPFRDGATWARPATNQAIADELVLSVAAVKTHLRALFERFGIEDLAQNEKRLRLVELAFESGLVIEREL